MFTGILLMWLLGVKLQWLPTFGYESFHDVGWGTVRYLLLPAVAVALGEIAVLTRMMRASSLEVPRLEYISHARAKGLSEPRGLLPCVAERVQSGARRGRADPWPSAGRRRVIKTVFTLPGMRRLPVESTYARDYPVARNCLL